MKWWKRVRAWWSEVNDEDFWDGMNDPEWTEHWAGGDGFSGKR